MNEKKKEASGLGLAAGGTAGLFTGAALGGPIGAVIGGIIGAMVGHGLEEESIKEKG